MRLVRRGIWLSLAAFTSGLALAAPASAQTLAQEVVPPQPGVGNVTGGDVTPEGAAPPMTQQAKDKVAATLAWDAATQAGDTAAAARALNAYAAKWGAPGAGSQAKSMSVTQAAAGTLAAPVSRSLGVVQVGQHNGFFCGPASGYEIVRFLHGAGFTSRFDGSAPGQAGLGNANHMATTKNRVTDWRTGRYVTGVNRWRGRNDYVQVNAPSAALVKSVFTNSIGVSGMPFAADTVEFAGGAHFNGHPNRTIGHWITAYGYSSSGAVGHWADSSTTLFPAAKRTFSYNTISFTKFLQSNGIAY